MTAVDRGWTRHDADLAHHRIEVERRGLLPRRKLLELLDLISHDLLHQIHLRHVIDHPVVVRVRIEVRPLERIAAEVHDGRHAQFHERLLPLPHGVRALLGEVELVIAHA